MSNNDYLVPVNVCDMVEKYKKMKHDNTEKLALEARLRAIKQYIEKSGIK